MNDARLWKYLHLHEEKDPENERAVLERISMFTNIYKSLFTNDGDSSFAVVDCWSEKNFNFSLKQ